MKKYNSIKKWLIASAILLSSIVAKAQCDYTSVILDNEAIAAPAVGFNAVGHTQTYVLVNATTGNVITSNATGIFAGPFAAGSNFQVHALNYDNSNAAPALTAGTPIANYIGVACHDNSFVCFEVRTRKQLCDNIVLDEISTSITGQNVAYTLQFVLVDATGTILASNATGNFGTRPAGDYCIHALNFDAALPPNPLPIVGSLATSIGSNSSGCSNAKTNFLNDKVCYTVNSPTTLTPTSKQLCTNVSTINLTDYLVDLGIPSGGAVSWLNAAGGSVATPTAADATDSPFTVSFTNLTGCVSTTTLSITINPIPTILLAAQADVCANSAPIPLTGANPSGGTYSVDGVVTNLFTPTATNIGSHTIMYDYVDATTGCSNSASDNFDVLGLPTVNIIATSDRCSSDLAFNLTNASPSGGIYSVDGVVTSSYDPDMTNAGPHYIVYTLNDALTGCSNVAKDTFVVNMLPTVTLTPLPNPCANDLPLSLSGGSPASGVYSVDGIIATTYDPDPSNTGNHTVVYLYTDAVSGCSNTATNSFFVNAQPNVMLLPIADKCETATAFTLTGGMPTGGSYAVDGTSSATFDPAPSNLGPHSVVYSYTDPVSSCSNVSSTTFDVVTCNFSFSIADPCLCMNNADDNFGTLGQFSEQFEIIGGVGPFLVQIFQVGTTVLKPNGVFDYALSNLVNEDANNQQYVASASGTTLVPVKFFGGTNFDVVITDVATGLQASILNSGGCAYPSLNAGTDVAVCQGAAVTINATMANVDAFSWSNGLLIEDISVNAGTAGTTATYTLSGTTTDGCLVSDAVSVAATSLPSASIFGTATICIGSTTPITISGTVGALVTISDGSIAVATVSIPASGSTTVNLGGGNYTIANVTNASCVGSGTGSASIATYNCSSTADIGGSTTHVWNDLDNDGVYEITEPSLSNVQVFVYDTGLDGIAGNADDVIITSGLTDSNGNFSFINVPVYDAIGNLINYYLLFPSSVTIGSQVANLTTPNIAGAAPNDPNDSDAFIGSSMTTPFSLTPSVTYLNIGAGYYVEIVAAVQLVNMNVNADCNGVEVDFTIADEHNTAYYIIQRSEDLQHWDIAGQVAAVGVHGVHYTYTFIDSFLPLQDTYYRIVEVENTGIEHLLPVRVAKAACEQEFTFTIFPNPTLNNLFYEITTPLDTRFVIQLIDLQGRILLNKEVIAFKGKTLVEISLDAYAAGVYYTGIKDNDVTKYQLIRKLVK